MKHRDKGASQFMTHDLMNHDPFIMKNSSSGLNFKFINHEVS